MSNDANKQTVKVKQFNLNTVLLGVLIAVAGWMGNKAFEKLDTNNTELIKVSQSQQFVVMRLGDLEKRVSGMVAKPDFEKEISRLNHELDSLRNRRGPQQ